MVGSIIWGSGIGRMLGCCMVGGTMYGFMPGFPPQGRLQSVAKGLGPRDAISSLRTLDTWNIRCASALLCAEAKSCCKSTPGMVAGIG